METEILQQAYKEVGLFEVAHGLEGKHTQNYTEDHKVKA